MRSKKVFEFYIANFTSHILNWKLVINSQLPHVVYQVWIGNIRHGKLRDEVWTALHNDWNWTCISTVSLVAKPFPQDSFALIEFKTEEQARQISNSCLNILTIKNLASHMEF